MLSCGGQLLFRINWKHAEKTFVKLGVVELQTKAWWTEQSGGSSLMTQVDADRFFGAYWLWKKWRETWPSTLEVGWPGGPDGEEFMTERMKEAYEDLLYWNLEVEMVSSPS